MALGADLTAQLSRIRGIRLGDLLQIFIKRYLLPYWSSLDLSSLEGRVFVEGELGRGKISVAPRGALLLIVPYGETILLDRFGNALLDNLFFVLQGFFYSSNTVEPKFDESVLWKKNPLFESLRCLSSKRETRI